MPYRHVFFDLDHTLWDFERNATEALREVYHRHALHQHGSFGEDDFVAAFLRVNYHLWDLYDTYQITQQQLRDTRFPLVFEALRAADYPHHARLGEDYLRTSPQKPHLVPHAREVLDYLRPRYTLHLITNGFADMQTTKTNSADITHYFTHLVTSERAGERKPHRQIFDYALRLAGADVGQSIMIGDNWLTDITGARAVGMDHVYYNPAARPCPASPTHDIRSLRELMDIL